MDLTLGFVAAIAVLLLLFHIRYTPRTVALGPTVLTMLGIFGCFVGIALGLRDFDVDNVAGSVPSLIAGIKTAFWASVAGIGAALTLKIRLVLLGTPPANLGKKIEGATIDDLAQQLRQLNQSLAGTEDSALISQVKLARADSNDRLDRLRMSLETFASKVADANTQALIAALEDVIRDFNAKINEQFGENFKHLNQAVEKLVVWQEQYKTQLDHLIEQETATRRTMVDASLRYTELVGKSKVFTDVAEQLDGLLNGLNQQRDAIASSLTSLGVLLEKAGSNLPKIEEKVIEMGRQVTSSVTAVNSDVQATIKGVMQANATANAELRTALAEAIRTTNRETSAHVRQLSEDVKKQVVALDAALEKELSRSLEGLGRQLTALSQRFVQDYTPLTERLREVVNVAGRL